VHTDEAGKGMDRREALIARGRSATTPDLLIAREGPNPLSRDVSDPDMVDPSAGSAR